MLLKKQTVWLLTMLSLVVVLSVYYLTAPEENAADMTATEQMEQEENKTESKTENKAETKGENKSEKETSKNTEGSSVTIASGDEFESLRMQIEDERAKLNEELTAKMGNTELSAEERDEAYAKIEQLSETKVKENIIENLIVAMDYNAALVPACKMEIKEDYRVYKSSNCICAGLVHLYHSVVQKVRTFRKW